MQKKEAEFRSNRGYKAHGGTESDGKLEPLLDCQGDREDDW
jgi:hypothetical protein